MAPPPTPPSLLLLHLLLLLPLQQLGFVPSAAVTHPSAAASTAPSALSLDVAGESSGDAGGGGGEGLQTHVGESLKHLAALIAPILPLGCEDALAGERLERVV